MNKMVFNLSHYDNDLDALLADVAKFIAILTQNGYELSFHYDDCGIYVLDYDYRDRELCDRALEWLDAEELETIYVLRQEKYEKGSKNLE